MMPTLIAKGKRFQKNLSVTSSKARLNHFTFLTRDPTKLFWKKAFYLPTANRYAKGTPIINILKLEEGEKVTALIPIKEFDNKHYLFPSTAPKINQAVTLLKNN